MCPCSDKNEMGCEDEWVRVAMSDDTLVVDMLLKLNQTAEAVTSGQPLIGAGGQGFGVEWSTRQRRSRHVLRKKGDQTRVSPSTPLSWSGATSVSGGGTGDGFEESSVAVNAKPVNSSRSKVTGKSETSSVKKSRRRKTLAELKEEESFLLKEKRDLRNRLTMFRVTLEKQRARNESLKRVKVKLQNLFHVSQLDLLSHHTPKGVAAFVRSEDENLGQAEPVIVASQSSSSITSIAATCKEIVPSPQAPEVGSVRPFFLVPDLNFPADEDSGSELLYGMS
ncbi:hypothetical protein K2173_019125 [Erythroxylum novogranatense]|uniref:BZIP domain-containing protein n=1 Tax=Erythroxylum novogranatense TaxID=1862640 RepID=A0AAV8SSS6_9ROSI|nr:hypothetical protein K2173_019125 [Erythroxylum novogranatense]